MALYILTFSTMAISIVLLSMVFLILRSLSVMLFCIMTLIILILGILTLMILIISIMKLIISTMSITTLSILSLSILTLSILTLSITVKTVKLLRRETHFSIVLSVVLQSVMAPNLQAKFYWICSGNENILSARLTSQNGRRAFPEQMTVWHIFFVGAFPFREAASTSLTWDFFFVRLSAENFTA